MRLLQNRSMETHGVFPPPNTHLNVTSLSSGLLTNLGSMRDPLDGCSTGSLICLIGSQPKHVLKMSASNSVVPSFCNRKNNLVRIGCCPR